MSNSTLYAQEDAYYSSHSFFEYEANIWKTVNEKLNFKAFSDYHQVQQKVRWFLKHPGELHALTYHASPYVYYVVEQLKKRGMPPEIALLPMIESDYNPMESNSKDAVGLWQLRGSTARGLGIHINSWYDGRRDVVASTHAALAYLQYLHDYFHNWLLAFAAYNAGIGTVMKAVSYNKAHNKPTDFWSLPLPAETKAYVPKLLAISTILANPKEYKLKTYPVANQPYFTTVKTNVPISLTHVAKLADANVKTIHNLNAGIKSPEAKPNTTYNILIPIAHLQQFQKGIEQVGTLAEEEKHSQHKASETVEMANRRNEHIKVASKAKHSAKTRLASNGKKHPLAENSGHSGLNFPVVHGTDA